MTVIFMFDSGSGNNVFRKDAWLAFRSLTGLPLCQTGIDPSLKLSRIRLWISPAAAYLLCGLQGAVPQDFRHNLVGARACLLNDSPAEILARLQTSGMPRLAIVANGQQAA